MWYMDRVCLFSVNKKENMYRKKPVAMDGEIMGDFKSSLFIYLCFQNIPQLIYNTFITKVLNTICTHQPLKESRGLNKREDQRGRNRNHSNRSSSHMLAFKTWLNGNEQIFENLKRFNTEKKKWLKIHEFLLILEWTQLHTKIIHREFIWRSSRSTVSPIEN